MYLFLSSAQGGGSCLYSLSQTGTKILDTLSQYEAMWQLYSSQCLPPHSFKQVRKAMAQL